ncbi:MAG: TlpA disulfide reductase family protein [Mycobacteriales bacterium]
MASQDSKTTATPRQPGKGRGAAARRAADRRQRLHIVIAAVGVTLVALVGFVAFRGSSTGSAVTTSTAFSLPALNGGGQVALADYAGKPTVVNFFASWCTACDEELPGFKAEADALKGTVTFLGVASLETGNKNLMPERHGLVGSFTALAQDVGGANGSGLHDELGGGNSMPLTAFYDSTGKLVDVQRTALSREALRQKMVDLFQIPA